MATALSLFIDTSSKSLVSDQTGGTLIQATSLPFFYPDNLLLNVYLLAPIGNSPLGNVQYQTIPTTGLNLLLYLDGGAENTAVLTQVVDWQSDPTNTYFIGTLQLNTLQLKQQLGNQLQFRCYLKIGFQQAGVSTTLIVAPIIVGAGLPTNNLVIPPGLVPLSVQAADQRYVKRVGLPGEGFYLTTPNGKKLFIEAVDQPDGTASFLASPVN